MDKVRDITLFWYVLINFPTERWRKAPSSLTPAPSTLQFQRTWLEQQRRWVQFLWMPLYQEVHFKNIHSLPFFFKTAYIAATIVEDVFTRCQGVLTLWNVWRAFWIISRANSHILVFMAAAYGIYLLAQNIFKLLRFLWGSFWSDFNTYCCVVESHSVRRKKENTL